MARISSRASRPAGSSGSVNKLKIILTIIVAYLLIGSAISFFFGVPWMVIIGLTMIGGFFLLIVAAALASITLG